MGLSPYGCVRMLAELLLGHQTLSCSPRASLAFWATQVGFVVHHMGERMGPWRRLGIRIPCAPYGGGGVLHRKGALTCDQKLF